MFEINMRYFVFSFDKRNYCFYINKNVIKQKFNIKIISFDNRKAYNLV